MALSAALRRPPRFSRSTSGWSPRLLSHPLPVQPKQTVGAGAVCEHLMKAGTVREGVDGQRHRLVAFVTPVAMSNTAPGTHLFEVKYRGGTRDWFQMIITGIGREQNRNLFSTSLVARFNCPELLYLSRKPSRSRTTRFSGGSFFFPQRSLRPI